MSVLTKEYFETEYIDKQRSLFSISKEFGVHRETVRQKLLSFGIKVRNIKEARTILSEQRASNPVKYTKQKVRNFYKPTIVVLPEVVAPATNFDEIDAAIESLAAEMEPLEDLLTGIRMNYDVLVMKRNNLLSHIKALDRIAAEG